MTCRWVIMVRYKNRWVSFMIPEDPRSAHICSLGRMYHVRFSWRRRIATDSIVDSIVVSTYRLSFKRNTSAPIPNSPSKGEEIFALRTLWKQKEISGRKTKSREEKVYKEREYEERRRERQKKRGWVKMRREKKIRNEKREGKSESEITCEREK